ncbi:hypothetical protein QE152_g6996 [Popillia japonica]|uniref:Uncharacterized protein n=1 Tax=Popillia japonica TaxID=7064 RepID=A0AAW1MGR6_POPJA
MMAERIEMASLGQCQYVKHILPILWWNFWIGGNKQASGAAMVFTSPLIADAIFGTRTPCPDVSNWATCEHLQ